MQDNPLSNIELLFERAKNYVDTRFQLIKLQALDKTADIISSLISKLFVVICLAFFSFFLSVGIALWIGDLLGKSYYGFFIVSGFYLLIALLFVFLRKPLLKTPVNDILIKEFLN